MNRWFRHYAGMMRDEKLVRAALVAKQPIERVTWVWGAALESAAEINDGGRYDLDTAEVAYFLRADEADIRAIFDALTASNRLAAGCVVNWGARQFQSDRSAGRQAAYRERKRSKDQDDDNNEPSCDGAVTAALRHGDAPETETETETETEAEKKENGSSADAERTAWFEEFWKVYPRRQGNQKKLASRKAFFARLNEGFCAADIIASTHKYVEDPNTKKIAGTSYIPNASTWLNGRVFEEYPPASSNVVALPVRFYAPDGSPELEAWDRYWYRTKGVNAPRDRTFGYWFDTQWPPEEDQHAVG